MPSHIHLIARSARGRLSDIIRDLKSYTAKKILFMIENDSGESRQDWLLHLFKFHAKYQKQNEKYQFWQKTNHPTELSYVEIFDQKVDYIHNNPVEAGLVSEAGSWIYSSANIFSPVTVIEG